MTPRWLAIDGTPAFLIGWNYWSRLGGPRMWDRFDAAVVDAEVAQMRGQGANVCRSFVFLPSFMPAPPAVAARPLRDFLTFLESCQRHGLKTMPSLLVGHMSGENYDFPGQRGRSPYTDPEVRAWTLALIDAVVGAAAGHPAILGWVLSNEMPLWGGRADVGTIREWATLVIERVRARDPGRPVGSGDGFMNAKGGENGFAPEALAPICDWLGPHTYFSDIDVMRQGLQTEVLVRSLEHHDRPILLEEFGCSSTQASEENAAQYTRETLHGLYSMGAGGGIVWCFSDLDGSEASPSLRDDPPYHHHAFELGFGSFAHDGRPKAAASEVASFARLVETLEPATLRFTRPRAAILVPSYFHREYPFSWEDRGRMRQCLLEAYALCVRAGVEVTVVPEGVDLGAFDFLVVASTQKLREPSWRAIEARVREGAVAWVSFFYGDHAFHQGMWWHSFQAMTGLEHQLRYGVPHDPGETVTIDGGTVRVPQGNPFAASYLPVEAAGADVVHRDPQGRIALARHSLGAGALYFCPFPLEHYLSRVPQVHREDRMWRLYATAAREVGQGALAAADARAQHHPWVQARRVLHGHRELLWLINRSDAPARLTVAPGQELLFPGPGLTETRLTLGPKGVAVLVPAAR